MPGIDHAQASMLVPDLVRGNLADPEKALVQAHVASCSDCRDLAESYQLMWDALRYPEPAIAPAHPESDEIVAFALRTGALAPSTLLRVEEHVRGCASCSNEVVSTRGAGEAAERIPPILESSARNLWGISFLRGHGLAAMAAAFAVAVLGYPAYLGLWKTPRLTEEIHSLRSEQETLREQVGDLNRSLDKARGDLDRATSWSGAVDYVLLLGRGRGAVETETLRIRAGQPYALVGIQPASPIGDAARTHRVEIVAQGGAVVWSWQTTGGELKRYLEQSETILLQVPTISLVAGPYTLRVVPEGNDHAVPLLEQRFQIVRD